MRFLNKTALVTGSSRGLGKQIALGLAQEGADLVINARSNINAAQEVADQIKAMGRKAIAIQADVCQAQQVKALVDQALEVFGRIDILVNNAGIQPFLRPAEEIREDGWDRILNVNLKGVFLCCQAVGRTMMERGGGNIVNISSMAGVLGERGSLPYSVSKAGVICLTRVLAHEWSRYNIRVNAVAPSFTEVGMNEVILGNETIMGKLREKLPLKRLARPEEVVEVVKFLASEASSYITGATINVDGGMFGYSPEALIDLIRRK